MDQSNLTPTQEGNFVHLRIIYPNDEGGVNIVVPSPNYKRSLEEFIQRSVPEGKSYQVVSILDIPTDREYRNAWTYEEV
jgi:hypothetical protein